MPHATHVALITTHRGAIPRRFDGQKFTPWLRARAWTPAGSRPRIPPSTHATVRHSSCRPTHMVDYNGPNDWLTVNTPARRQASLLWLHGREHSHGCAVGRRTEKRNAATQRLTSFDAAMLTCPRAHKRPNTQREYDVRKLGRTLAHGPTSVLEL